MNKDFSDAKIRLATERAGYLWPYVRGRKLSKHAVLELTAKLQCSRSSLFRYLAKLRDEQTVTALVPKKRGRKPLSSLITQQHEDVIASELKGHFLTRDRAGFDEVVRRVFVELQNRGYHLFPVTPLLPG
jgi:biotin operon repressor